MVLEVLEAGKDVYTKDQYCCSALISVPRTSGTAPAAPGQLQDLQEHLQEHLQDHFEDGFDGFDKVKGGYKLLF